VCKVIWRGEEWETNLPRPEWQLQILERCPEYKIGLKSGRGKGYVMVPMAEISFNGQKQTRREYALVS
jgi:hypothetical protein